jgi:chromosome segregation ATPase
MSENDKLKRDLNAQVTKCQDLEKSLQTYKPQIEALRAENDNLSHARGVDSSLIARRDRKIEELKAELASERERRERAESLARQREKEREEAEEGSRREVQRAGEESRHATLHAEILETSHKQLSAEYKARAEKWRKDLEAINENRTLDRQRMERLDVVAEQMRTEVERSRKANGEIVEAWERLRTVNEEKMRGLVDETEEENERVRQLSEQMDKVVGEMRWVMGVRRNVKDAAVDGEQQ